MNFPDVVSAASRVNSAISSLKGARELAKSVSDSELKEKISDAYDVLLELKERTYEQEDAIRELKRQLAEKAAYVGPIAPHGYFYAASDEHKQHPLCPICFQGKQRQVAFLNRAYGWNGGIRRECKLCNSTIWEKSMDL